MFELEVSLQNSDSPNNEQVRTTSGIRTNSDQSYLVGENEKTTAKGKHARNLFVTYRFIKKIAGVLFRGVHAVE